MSENDGKEGASGLYGSGFGGLGVMRNLADPRTLTADVGGARRGVSDPPPESRVDDAGPLEIEVNSKLTDAEACLYQASSALASGGDAAHSIVRARRLLAELRGLLAL